MKPATLDHAGIAALVPHSGNMCLLDRLLEWGETHIRCSAISHHDPAHPLRVAAGLLSPTGIEYAAQAMALHGSLSADPDTPPTPGFLASVRSVSLFVPRLDTVQGELQISAQRLMGDGNQALYAFALHSAAGAPLIEGRATVILNALP